MAQNRHLQSMCLQSKPPSVQAKQVIPVRDPALKVCAITCAWSRPLASLVGNKVPGHLMHPLVDEEGSKASKAKGSKGPIPIPILRPPPRAQIPHKARTLPVSTSPWKVPKANKPQKRTPQKAHSHHTHVRTAHHGAVGTPRCNEHAMPFERAVLQHTRCPAMQAPISVCSFDVRCSPTGYLWSLRPSRRSSPSLHRCHTPF